MGYIWKTSQIQNILVAMSMNSIFVLQNYWVHPSLDLHEYLFLGTGYGTIQNFNKYGKFLFQS